MSPIQLGGARGTADVGNLKRLARAGAVGRTS